MIFEKLKEIIYEVLNVSKEEIKPESDFRGDLGVDSLDMFQIVMGIEEEFDIVLQYNDFADVETVQDAVRVIGTLVKN